MQSAVDISQNNLRLLSNLELEEEFKIVYEIINRISHPKAVAIVMWDADLENIADHPVFGEQKKELQTFIQSFMENFDGSLQELMEINAEEHDEKLAASLLPVFLYPLKDKDIVCAWILVAGCSELDLKELETEISLYPLAMALSRAWEYRELKRENDRLRGQYEDLDNSIRSMEEQTRKLIHDMMAKDVLVTKKIQRDSLVYGISNAVRSSLKIDEVLQNAVNEIGKTLSVTHCLLLRPIKDPGNVVVFEYHNPAQSSIKELFSTPAGYKFMQVAMNREAPQALANPRTDLQSVFDRYFLQDLGLLSGLIIPLALRDYVLGVLFLQESNTPREWSIDDVALLGSLADQLSVAIENADLHQEREHQAVTDALTGIANRRHFNDVFYREFERAKRYEQSLSLVLVDLDLLKKVNDTYGHHTGDQAIRVIARLMQQSSRSVDLAARYGGEEFCLLLPNTDLEMASQIAQRLKKLINEAEVEGPGKISASIGVASFPDHADDADSVFDAADVALYQAKQSGRNKVCIAVHKNPDTDSQSSSQEDKNL